MSENIENSLDELSELGETYDKIRQEYDLKNDSWWNSLTEEERQEAFYAVCKRIYKGDIVENGTYRYVLYEVFKFDSGMYMPGMDCGYMDIHDHIFDGYERKAMNHINRLEIIDETGRAYVKYFDENERARYSLQDDNRTLKVFIDEVVRIQIDE